MAGKYGVYRKYIELAEQAAKLEREKEYSEASIYWADAVVCLLDTQSANLGWAINRAEFCQHWATRLNVKKEQMHEA
ncbi:ANR family transcriptional regulator [Vibrio sp. OPT18]|uniref:ANR family transcriptional regulator n=1 Tax=Vibrio sp. OPT18 TaxID=2778641 RepID=UPI001880A76B|nr:ANR family transcriptional regulator [Vibrio sp. OPT18]MBE8578690.1 ANR family transcriptional regulator [Vibrio sp. OPT18]